MKATLDEMRTFMAVVDTGSISSAAELLSMTVSAVSRSVSRLEAKLETTLLNRTTRKLDVTNEGTIYLDKVRHIVEAVENAEAQLKSQKYKPSGLLRINAATPFLLHVLTPHIAKYQSFYPEVEIDLNSNEENISLLGTKTDIAFRIGELQNSTMRAIFLGKSRIRIVASPEYLRQHGTPTSIDQLLNHKLLGFNKPEYLKEWPIMDDKNKLLRIMSSLRSDNGETLRCLALHGAGIACLSDFMTYSDRQAGRLVGVLSEHTHNVEQPVHAVYYKNASTSRRISSFIDFIKQEIKVENHQFL
ncbi:MULTISPECIES: LysR family transcriptional regulator [Vibrio]|uniref:LysR family transcriptional regulator n=1 Tax=Vibrio TaxID=662 RepID=UPI001CDCFB66|nr:MULTISPECIES: LysR family transcriptional regulator [Vibrio]EIK0773565.1 LysR family transcriptional regulator [Vibrio alginolyticus]EJU9973321.1 LysR family transcriptional regulator [Vibrio alginolyticus]EKA3120928.1 LysR family transcriptional regulator [Vibrio alginolyticus]EKL9829873.1 LysR family transcriptional regulator [Vibrio alginolyticus]ELA8078271.1 LysR family transcriptional regulator [Vibrio alginolyticus]